MINRLLINSAQNTNVRTLPTRFLEIISSKNSSINDQPNESPNFQRCFNAPNELGEWAFLFVLVASICLFSYTHQIPQHCIIMMWTNDLTTTCKNLITYLVITQNVILVNQRPLSLIQATGYSFLLQLLAEIFTRGINEIQLYKIQKIFKKINLMMGERITTSSCQAPTLSQNERDSSKEAQIGGVNFLERP